MTRAVTFYSFKGGVGRTLALANTAYILASRMQRRVLIWELDLEAPGLLRIPEFSPWAKNAKGGMVDLLLDPVLDPERLRAELPRAVIEQGDPKVPGLLILPAGLPDSQYGQRYASVDWSRFFAPGTDFGKDWFLAVKRALIDVYQPDFLLIDSRTGLTDIGGICTVLLPDTVVLVFNLSHQGFDGIDGVRRSIEKQGGPGGIRSGNPIRLLKVASPVPASPPELRQDRIRSARESGMGPDFIVTFEESLLLSEQVAAWAGPDVANFATFESLARALPLPGDGPGNGEVRYRTWLESSTRWMDLPLAPASLPRFELDKLFVPLWVRTGQDLADAASLRDRLLWIEGPPGSGKSTLLRSAARAALRGGQFPVLVRLPEVAAFVSTAERWALVNLLPSFLASLRLGLTETEWHDRLSLPDAWVLLDGLEEIPSQMYVWDKIAASAHVYPQCRFWVTTRPYSPASGRSAPKSHGFTRVTIEGWDNRAILAFLENWSGCSGISMDPLRSALSTSKDLRDLAGSPILLTALASVASENRAFPEQRSQVFERLITCLVSLRENYSYENRLRALERLALTMQIAPGSRMVEIEKGDAKLAIRSVPSGYDFNFEAEELRSGIVTVTGPQIRFTHLSFQEFLAARALARLDEPPRHEELLRDGRAFRPDWRECVVLLAGIIAHRDGHRSVDRLIEAIAVSAGAKLADQITRAGLIGAIARSLLPDGYRPDSPAYAAILKNLPRIFLPRNARLASPGERAEAADALGLAGDVRIHLPSHPGYWVSLPGGTFEMGGGGTAQPVRKVRVKPFDIGRFPVTVFEFARYVESGGAPPHDWAAQCHYPNRPVSTATLEQAEAYCRWAGCRLATDAEWEFAARGPLGRRYPWGDGQPEEWLANFDGHLRQPSPAGLYPLGCTPEGIADLAGNVYEWTSAGSLRGGDAWTPAAGLAAAEIRPSPAGLAGFRCALDPR